MGLGVARLWLITSCCLSQPVYSASHDSPNKLVRFQQEFLDSEILQWKNEMMYLSLENTNKSTWALGDILSKTRSQTDQRNTTSMNGMEREEGKNERTKKQKKERKNERTKEWKNERKEGRKEENQGKNGNIPTLGSTGHGMREPLYYFCNVAFCLKLF